MIETSEARLGNSDVVSEARQAQLGERSEPVNESRTASCSSDWLECGVWPVKFVILFLLPSQNTNLWARFFFKGPPAKLLRSAASEKRGRHFEKKTLSLSKPRDKYRYTDYLNGIRSFIKILWPITLIT